MTASLNAERQHRVAPNSAGFLIRHIGDVELLFAALTPFERAAFTATQPPGTPFPTTCLPGAGSTLSRYGQLGAYGLNTEIRGWERHDMAQLQFTATKAFANVLGASQLVLVGEFGVTQIFGMEDKLTGGPKGRGLRYNGPATSVSGNEVLAGRHFNEVEPQENLPTTPRGVTGSPVASSIRDSSAHGMSCRASPSRTTCRASRPARAAISRKGATASPWVSAPSCGPPGSSILPTPSSPARVAVTS